VIQFCADCAPSAGSCVKARPSGDSGAGVPGSVVEAGESVVVVVVAGVEGGAIC
jgi:hypothetical protein